MMQTADILPVILALVLGLSVVLYVLLDGFDLGIGMLFFAFPEEQDRDLIMNSVAPFWDGNETWLVLGGVTLWAAFPKGFSIIMPAMYLPVLLLLLSLIFRGVAFEFRWVAKPHHRGWDWAFACGSLLAGFAQGLVLGGILQEIPVKDGQFAGVPLWWLSPFSIVCGLAVATGYALLGACWLLLKTTPGALHDKARRIGTLLLLALLGFIVVVSIWTPLASHRIAERWFSFPNVLLLAPLPVFTAAFSLLGFTSLRRKGELLPFVCSIMIFLLTFLGLVASNVPYLVPPSMTVWQAASHETSQLFLLVGEVILIPVILAYTVLTFWLFRGKLEPGQGYH